MFDAASICDTNGFTGELSAAPVNYNARIHDTAESCALRYLVEGDVSFCQKALQAMRGVLPAVTFPVKQDITREKGATIFTAALVYDWCYPLLSEADKRLFIEHMKRIAKLMEIGYPPLRQDAVTGLYVGTVRRLSAVDATFEADELINQKSPNVLRSARKKSPIPQNLCKSADHRRGQGRRQKNPTSSCQKCISQAFLSRKRIGRVARRRRRIASE